jgi:hypothetical protein
MTQANTANEGQVMEAMESAYLRMNEAYDKLADRVFTPEEKEHFVAVYKARTEALEETRKRLERDNAQWFERYEAEAKKWDNRRRWATWLTWAMFWLSGFFLRGVFINNGM